MAACQYEAQIRATAIRYGINPDIAVAQFLQENGCRPVGCSGAGACGIAQFIPSTAAAYGLTDRNNVDASIDAWGRLMRDLLNRFGGDYRLALAGYHSGPGAANAALNNCAGNPKTCGYVNSILGSAGTTGTPGGDGSPASSVSPVTIAVIALIAILALR
jgi:soluble lytic murein transglycosylase-like protein